jgi:hypothetical protein
VIIKHNGDEPPKKAVEYQHFHKSEIFASFVSLNVKMCQDRDLCMEDSNKIVRELGRSIADAFNKIRVHDHFW